jgi:hypothetical protein
MEEAHPTLLAAERAARTKFRAKTGRDVLDIQPMPESHHSRYTFLPLARDGGETISAVTPLGVPHLCCVREAQRLVDELEREVRGRGRGEERRREVLGGLTAGLMRALPRDIGMGRVEVVDDVHKVNEAVTTLHSVRNIASHRDGMHD